MLLNTGNDIGLAVNTGKTKYMEVRHHQGIVSFASHAVHVHGAMVCGQITFR